MRTTLTNPFFANRAQVVDLARRRYFDDGVPPAGIISDAVFQSWTRCQRLHDRPERQVEFQPVTQSRAQFALQRNRTLHEAWQAEVPNLQMLLGTRPLSMPWAHRQAWAWSARPVPCAPVPTPSPPCNACANGSS